MKQDTRILMDYLDDLLVGDLLARKARSFLVAAEKEGVVASVSLVAREWPDEIVDVTIYENLTWIALEELCAKGWMEKFSLGRSFSFSKLSNAGTVFSFSPDQLEREILAERLVTFVKKDVVPGLYEKQNPRFIIAEEEASVLQGGGYPERLMCGRFLLGDCGSIPHCKNEVISQLTDDFLVSRLEAFYANLAM